MNTFEIKTDTGDEFRVEALDIEKARIYAETILNDTTTPESGTIVSIVRIN